MRQWVLQLVVNRNYTQVQILSIVRKGIALTLKVSEKNVMVHRYTARRRQLLAIEYKVVATVVFPDSRTTNAAVLDGKAVGASVQDANVSVAGIADITPVSTPAPVIDQINTTGNDSEQYKTENGALPVETIAAVVGGTVVLLLVVCIAYQKSRIKTNEASVYIEVQPPRIGT